LNRGERYEDIIDHSIYIRNLSSCKIKPEKNSGLVGIRIHDLFDTGAVLYRLSYQVIWELVRNIPADGEEYKWTAAKEMKT